MYKLLTAIKYKLSKFIHNKSAILSIEFIMIFLTSVCLIFIAIDFSLMLLQQGKIERINHSLASVLRERSSLYSNNGALSRDTFEYVTQQDVDQLARLAVKLLGRNDIALKVEQLHFDENSLEKIIDKKRSNQIDANGMNGQCKIDMAPFKTFVDYSSRSQLNRWLPLYRVTLCIPAKQSMLTKIISFIKNDKVINELSVSNLVVPR